MMSWLLCEWINQSPIDHRLFDVVLLRLWGDTVAAINVYRSEIMFNERKYSSYRWRLQFDHKIIFTETEYLSVHRTHGWRWAEAEIDLQLALDMDDIHMNIFSSSFHSIKIHDGNKHAVADDSLATHTDTLTSTYSDSNTQQCILLCSHSQWMFVSVWISLSTLKPFADRWASTTLLKVG